MEMSKDILEIYRFGGSLNKASRFYKIFLYVTFIFSYSGLNSFVSAQDLSNTQPQSQVLGPQQNASTPLNSVQQNAPPQVAIPPGIFTTYPAPPLSPPHAAPSPITEGPPSIFSDPFGMTSWLRKNGIGFHFDNTNEYAGALQNPTKGPHYKNYRDGSSNAGQYSANLVVDWEHLAGIKGFVTRMTTIGRYGTTANRMFGDWLAHSSEIYGGGGNVVVHLVSLYGEESLFGGRFLISGGRMSQMSDFASSPIFCSFQNNSFCGRPKAAADSNYYGSYPAATWAFHMKGRPRKDLYIQTAVYFAENGIYMNYQHRTGFKFNGANIVGYEIPVEAQWEPHFGSHHNLPGHYKLGFVYDDVRRPDNYYNTKGQSYYVYGGVQRMRDSSWQTYFMFDQKLMNYSNRPETAGLTFMGGYIYNSPHTAVRDFEVYGALISQGLIPGRPEDMFGVAFSYVSIAPGTRDTTLAMVAAGKYVGMPNHATGVQTNAEVFEVDYSINVMRGVTFRPDFQYYMNPNGQVGLRNSAMLGFKSYVSLF